MLNQYNYELSPVGNMSYVQYKKILKILEKEGSTFVFLLYPVKAENTEEYITLKEETESSLIINKLTPFLVECFPGYFKGMQIKRKKKHGKKGQILLDNVYIFRCEKGSINVLREYSNFFYFEEGTGWIDVVFFKENIPILTSIAHESICCIEKTMFQKLLYQ